VLEARCCAAAAAAAAATGRRIIFLPPNTAEKTERLDSRGTKRNGAERSAAAGAANWGGRKKTFPAANDYARALSSTDKYRPHNAER
jgi:hypothetical protein